MNEWAETSTAGKATKSASLQEKIKELQTKTVGDIYTKITNNNTYNWYIITIHQKSSTS